MTDTTRRSYDHHSAAQFIDYYESASLSPATIARFTNSRDRLLQLYRSLHPRVGSLDVADIGCGAGTQSRLWAQSGHRVHGLDVNAKLIELARERATSAGFPIRFDVGSATALPYSAASMDVVLLPEVLEHIVDWEACLREAARVLRPGGLLYISTTNVLCPIQDEMALPGYSWYPGFVKRHVERLALTTHPHLAGYARYPAVNWFSFPKLARHLRGLGLRALDQFDLADPTVRRGPSRWAVLLLRALRPLRFAVYPLIPYTLLVGIREPDA